MSRSNSKNIVKKNKTMDLDQNFAEGRICMHECAADAPLSAIQACTQSTSNELSQTNVYIKIWFLYWPSVGHKC